MSKEKRTLKGQQLPPDGNQDGDDHDGTGHAVGGKIVDSAELKTVKKGRAGARVWATRTSNELDNILQDRPVNLDIVRDQMRQFEHFLKKLDSWQSAVESHCEDDLLEEEIAVAFDYRCKLRRPHIEAAKLLATSTITPVQRHASLSSPGADLIGSGDGADFAIGSKHGGDSTAKLPRLELTMFDGTLTSWQPFYERFVALVDSRKDLPEVTKFAYLQTSLKGEALSVISGLSLTADNYHNAITMLKERFGQEKRIIFSHIQALLNVEISGGNSPTVNNLWSLQDCLLGHVRSLENLGVSGEEYGLFLTPLILSRLPTDLRMEWARDSAGKESDLDSLLEFLKCEIQRRERSNAFSSMSVKSVVKEKPKATSHIASSSALYTGTSTVTCIFCAKPHPSKKCWKILKKSMDERHLLIKELGACFRCLSVDGHRAQSCSEVCSKCKGRHHELLCRVKSFDRKLGNNSSKGSGPNSVAGQTQRVDTSGSTQVKGTSDNIVNLITPALSATADNMSNSASLVSVLQTAKVLVGGRNGTVEATAVFDTGSDCSYISSALVKKVDPEWVTAKYMSYAAFGGGKTSARTNHNVYRLNLHGKLGKSDTLKAVEVKTVCAPLHRSRVSKEMLQSIGNLEMADDYGESRDVQVDMLIGLDSYWRFMKGGMIRLSDSLVAQESIFGWLLSGCSSGSSDSACLSVVNSCLMCLSDVPDSTLQRFWDLESIGVSPESSGEGTCPVLSKFTETIQVKDGRYHVQLPWKENASMLNLMNNRKIAELRLKSLSRRFEKEPELGVRYNQAIREMETLGIIEEVPESQMSTTGTVFYLPHHPVVKETKVTTKVRPVFDASAKGINGVSLNDCLEAGPCLLSGLVDILMRFRRWRIAITADISKAFLQIGVQKQDQDVHRFLWEVDGQIRTMRFLRVPFGATCSPFLLNATIQHHLAKYPDSRAVEELRDNLYVDDFISGADEAVGSSDLSTHTEESDGESACSLYRDAERIMSEGGFPLAKCNSNDERVNEMFFEEFGVKQSGVDYVKVLGLKWLRSEDCFTFDGILIPTDIVITKRVVLSYLARLFDPLGFMTPYTMQVKIILQDLWLLNVDWDVEVSPDIQSRFQQWLQGLGFIRNWKIPRCYTSLPWTGLVGLELHCFGDASERGYGAVIYLRVPRGDDTFEVSMVTARARVSPLKKVSLPRLELLGSLLAARLFVMVKAALKLPEVKYHCWTDSTVSLAWIQGSPTRWKTFISNRVTEIRKLTDPTLWSHCEGDSNPADLVTRGLSAEKLVTSETWLKGPDWLSKPLPRQVENVPSEVVEEFVQNEALSSKIAKVSLPAHTHQVPQRVYEVERSSLFEKSVHVIGWVRRFVYNLRHRGSHHVGHLSQGEIAEAKSFLLQEEQMHAFPVEYEALKLGKSVSRTSPLHKLSPYLDPKGLMRVKGRLQHAELSYSERHPVILSKGHLAKTLVRSQHLQLKHTGVQTLVTSLRDEYWIIGLRRLAKNVKKQCVPCQRVDSPALNQVAAPLPGARVQQTSVFAVCGLDHAGPLYCIDLPQRKLYILLFTCGVVRAVHLELVDSLCVADTILALRRFVARRGLPSIVYSDNSKSFEGSERECQRIFGSRCPEWRFITPRSPWHGGFWERMVRTVKNALRKALGNRCLTRSELETSLHEAEMCVNSRPLTFVSDMVEDTKPLTPSLFLIGRNSSLQVPTVSETEPYIMSQKSLGEREIVRQQRLEQFWGVWNKEYLRSLPPAVSKFRCQGNAGVGSLVLIREDNTPRMKWLKGVISRVFPSVDGVARTVEIKTASGKLVRPLQRLHNLEVTHSDEQGGNTQNQHSTTRDQQPEGARATNKTPNSVVNVDSGVVNNEELPGSLAQPVVTRRGRVIKVPTRLDL